MSKNIISLEPQVSKLPPEEHTKTQFFKNVVFIFCVNHVTGSTRNVICKPHISCIDTYCKGDEDGPFRIKNHVLKLSALPNGCHRHIVFFSQITMVTQECYKD